VEELNEIDKKIEEILEITRGNPLLIDYAIVRLQEAAKIRICPRCGSANVFVTYKFICQDCKFWWPPK
jgi:NADH pyrophosphatase NudC (nudix superfamily)